MTTVNSYSPYGQIEEYVLQDLFKWLASPAREVNEEVTVKKDLNTKDINYSIYFIEHSKLVP